MTIRNTILATIAYADVFDYPLTEEELRKWVIEDCAQCIVHSAQLQEMPEIKDLDGYFFLNGRISTVAIRKQRAKWAREKMRVARKAAKILKFIPTIKLVGATGALAMENAHQDDDIDFYVVTAAGTLWTTRFFATALLELFGLRRKPADTSFCNKICLNMYVDEGHLAVPKNERDLFSAHEVLQMKPLWEKDHTYWKFLRANEWVREFLPNAWQVMSQESKVYSVEKESNHFSLFIFHLLEPLARTLQLWYMRRRRTLEVISGSVIRFHPHDARVWIKEGLSRRLYRYKLPLDKIFYAR